MTRKQLPKAIRRNEGLSGIAADAVMDGETRTSRSAPPHHAGDAEPALAISSSAAANDFVATASTRADPLALRRRTLGRKIVERHKYYAAAGGLVPLPVANVAGVTVVIVRMVKALSDLYGVPFERDRTRSIIVGLMGGAVPTGLAAATASTLAFAVPVSGLVGLAVASVSAAAFTRGIGLVFVEHFESGATLLDFGETAPA